MSALSASLLSAQTTYTTVPSAAQLDWNTAASWIPTTGAGTQYPGADAGDMAIVSGPFGGAAHTVDLSAPPANPLTGIVLGDTTGTGTTLISSANASSLSLSAAVVTSAGTAGAVNTISASITSSGNLTFGPVFDTSTPPVVTTPVTNDLTLTGAVAQTGPATIANNGEKALTLGDINVTGGLLTISNANTAGTKIVLNGVIASTAGVTFTGALNSGGYEINGANTYTGATILNGNATYKLNSNSPFGTGSLQVGNTSGQTLIFEAVGMDREIPNPSGQLRRTITFNGSNSITFKGSYQQNNPGTWTNNLPIGKSVVFAGNVATSSNADGGRTITITGAGTTVFAGNVNDTLTQTVNNSLGYVINSGTGTFVVTGTTTLQGGFRITSGGTVQMGNGGTTGVLTPLVVGSNPAKRSIVASSAAATGGFAVNRSDALTLATTINGGIGLRQIGAGDVTVDTANYNTGANSVGDGVNPARLIVTAGSVSESSRTGTIGTATPGAAGSTNNLQLMTLADTTGLQPGQPVYAATATASPATYILSVNSATEVAVIGTAIPVDTTEFKFGAGSSLGSGTAVTTINNLGILSGTGAVSGTVHLLPGGGIAPGVNTAGDSGAAGTLTTGALTLDAGSKLSFDVDATAAGANDHIATDNQNVTLGAVNITYSGLAGGTLQTGVPYTLINAGTGTITTDPASITSTFLGALNGYTAAYANTGSTLTVTFSGESTGGGGAYSDWSATNAPGQTADQDYDHDGVSNGVEYFMGQSGTGFTATPAPDSTGKIVWPKSPTFAGTYTVQTSATLLQGSWTDVPSTLNGNQVEYTLPTGQGKVFARLKVNPN